MCVARSSPTCEPSRMDIREQRWQAVGFLRRDMRSDPRNDRCAPFATNRLVLGERTNRSYRVVPSRFPARQSAATFLSVSVCRSSFVVRRDFAFSFNVQQTANTSFADRSSDTVPRGQTRSDSLDQQDSPPNSSSSSSIVGSLQHPPTTEIARSISPLDSTIQETLRQ